jgi:hypothetical protein
MRVPAGATDWCWRTRTRQPPGKSAVDSDVLGAMGGQPVDPRSRVGLRRTFYAVVGMVLSRSTVLARWQCRQGVELGLVQGDVGRGGVGGDLLFGFGADDGRGDSRAG